MIMTVHETILNSSVGSAGGLFFGIRVKVVFDVLWRDLVGIAADGDFGDGSKFALYLDTMQTDRVVRVAYR